MKQLVLPLLLAMCASTSFAQDRGGVNGRLAAKPAPVSLSGTLVGRLRVRLEDGSTVSLKGARELKGLEQLFEGEVRVTGRFRSNRSKFDVTEIVSPSPVRLKGVYSFDASSARLELPDETVSLVPRIEGFSGQRVVFPGWRERTVDGSWGAFHTHGIAGRVVEKSSIKIDMSVGVLHLPSLELALTRGWEYLIVGRKNATTLVARYASSKGEVPASALVPQDD